MDEPRSPEDEAGPEREGAEAPPRDFEGLRDLLLARRDTLPRRLSQVAAYMIANTEDIAFGTVAVIAEAAHVQPSTLIRFAQALGYGGFSELQAIFRDRLRDRNAGYEERLQSLRAHQDGTVRTAALFEGVIEAAEQSLRSLKGRLDPASIEQAVGVLQGAQTVYLVGLRRSFPVTAYMAYAFGKLGIRAVLAGSAIGIDRETLAHAGPGDAAVLVSFTPYASATVEHAAQLAAQGVPRVVISDSPFSPLVTRDGIWFEVVERDFEGFRPLSAAMVLGMTLAIALADARRAKE